MTDGKEAAPIGDEAGDAVGPGAATSRGTAGEWASAEGLEKAQGRGGETSNLHMKGERAAESGAGCWGRGRVPRRGKGCAIVGEPKRALTGNPARSIDARGIDRGPSRSLVQW